MSLNYRSLSKTVSLGLRHRPQAFGLVLDEAGWTDVVALLQALRQQKRFADVTEADLKKMMAGAQKQRFEMTNGRIRALYGHSLKEKIVKMPAFPPTILYHGTLPNIANIILQEGLKPMKRQYVHLSVDVATATMVGKRRSPKPTILQIKAQEAHNAGIFFYPSQDETWLADNVPPAFIAIHNNVA